MRFEIASPDENKAHNTAIGICCSYEFLLWPGKT
jgi:hypothetical protein